MKIALLIPLVVACAASQPQTSQVLDSDGDLFWEFESIDGIPDGESRTYYPDGELQSIATFHHAEFHGPFVKYHPDGTLAFKAYFWHDVLVWKEDSGEPSVELLTELLSVHDPVEVRRRFGDPHKRISAYEWFYNGAPPSPRFLFTNWRVSDRPLVGARVRAGGASATDTVAVSESIFAQVPIGIYAVSVMFTQSQLHIEGARVWGRSVLELGGNRRWDTKFGQVITHGSLSFPVAGEDATNALITAATIAQSPEMAVTSVGSTVAMRASASWIRREEKWGIQGDLGADTAVGGNQAPSLLFIHAAVAGAYGVRSLYGTLELSTVGRLGTGGGMITSAGIGGAFRALGVDTKLLVGTSNNNDVTATLGVEYEF